MNACRVPPHLHEPHQRRSSPKKLILEAYDNMYTSQLEDYLLQYANRSALEILMHLKHTYGFINPTQLTEN
jgi:hypothetical protein